MNKQLIRLILKSHKTGERMFVAGIKFDGRSSSEKWAARQNPTLIRAAVIANAPKRFRRMVDAAVDAEGERIRRRVFSRRRNPKTIIADPETAGRIFTHWKPLEVSVVPIPADPNAILAPGFIDETPDDKGEIDDE